jgi:hypothetical protein
VTWAQGARGRDGIAFVAGRGTCAPNPSMLSITTDQGAVPWESMVCLTLQNNFGAGCFRTLAVFPKSPGQRLLPYARTFGRRGKLGSARWER